MEIRDIHGFCPACGEQKLHLMASNIVHCLNPNCPQPNTMAKLMMDKEIHHIVRFDPDSETFNVKHPLRERVDSELLDCQIHGVVQAQIGEGKNGQIYSEGEWHPLRGTWRLKFEPAWLEDPEFGGDPFSWEKA